MEIDWKKVEEEFFATTREGIAHLAKNGCKEHSITFWVHVDYMPDHLQCAPR